MKHLTTYLEDAMAATPSNTMGMGNPGETASGELTEPIGKAFSEVEKDKKKKKRRIKSLAESLFDKNLASKNTTIKSKYKVSFYSHDKTMFDMFFIDSLVENNDYEENIKKIVEDMPIAYLDDEKLMLTYFEPYFKPLEENQNISITKYNKRPMSIEIFRGGKPERGNGSVGIVFEILLKKK